MALVSVKGGYRTSEQADEHVGQTPRNGHRPAIGPSPTIGDAINAGFLYLEVRCLGCDTNQTGRSISFGVPRRRRCMNAVQELFGSAAISIVKAGDIAALTQRIMTVAKRLAKVNMTLASQFEASRKRLLSDPALTLSYKDQSHQSRPMAKGRDPGVNHSGGHFDLGRISSGGGPATACRCVWCKMCDPHSPLHV